LQKGESSVPHDLFPDDAFPPARNAPCYCGSGRRFKRCCGRHSADRSTPHGIGIVEDFLSPAECRDFVEVADSMTGHRFTAFDADGHRVLDPHRATEWVDFRSSGQERLDDLVYRALAEHVVPDTGLGIEWFEQPEVLRYGPGGYYRHHSDAYYLLPEKRAWRKAVDRDISLLIYFNDDYEGGELDFKRLSFRLRPRAGMLVWFPSDVRYEHMAMPVERGRRYCLASWAAVTGVERVQSERAKRAIAWTAREPKGATGRRVD
jgi:predicted 2-oxoglutarate/Fe(II)-dependent dioxygenase YbiX